MRDSSIRFSGEVLPHREILVNNIASNSLVERVLTLMGGGARRSAPFRPLTRCDVVGVNVLGVNAISLSEGEGCFQCEDLSIRKQGEGLSRRVSNCKIKKFSVGLVNPTYKTLNFPHPLREGVRGWGLISSRRERGLLDYCNDFPLSIFHFPFIQQPTPKEVFQC